MSTHDDQGPTRQQIYLSSNSGFSKLPAIFGVLGIAGLAGAAVTMGDHEQNVSFYHAYLTALMYWLALGLGGLFFVLIQHATRAGWSIVVRRLAEHAMLTLVPLSLLAIPVAFFGVHDLYHWSHTDTLDIVLQAKAAYLNEGFFQTRAIVFMAVWIGAALLFWRWSTSQDKAADPVAITHKMRLASPFGIMFFALSLTFAVFDWVMSLDPHWFSTIFGVYYFAGCVSMIHAFLALVVIALHRAGHLKGIVTQEHFHDLGKMMFAFTVFWTYIGFSQYMLIWYASIPEETDWFAYRGVGAMLSLSIILVVVKFVVPFIGLMSRKIKRNYTRLGIGAVWLMCAHMVDMVWLVHPPMAEARHNANPFHPELNPTGVHEGILQFGFVDVATFVGIGGIVLATFFWALSRHALVPVKDPRLAESINHENF